jgi:hypothetical protein
VVSTPARIHRIAIRFILISADEEIVIWLGRYAERVRSSTYKE